MKLVSDLGWCFGLGTHAIGTYRQLSQARRTDDSEIEDMPTGHVCAQIGTIWGKACKLFGEDGEMEMTPCPPKTDIPTRDLGVGETIGAVLDFVRAGEDDMSFPGLIWCYLSI